MPKESILPERVFVRGRVVSIGCDAGEALLRGGEVQIQVATELEEPPDPGEVFAWSVPGGKTGLMKVLYVARDRSVDLTATVVLGNEDLPLPQR